MALLHVNYWSEVLNLQTQMDVLLPQRPSPRPDGLWPTLYLLHGYSDDHTIWQRKTSIERYVDPLGLAVVMPAAHNSFYTDLPGGRRYFAHFSEEIPTICERLFPLVKKREGRFVAGLSMGGYGAFKMALRCPDRFAAGASLSGALDVIGLMKNDEHLSKRDVPFFGVFGPIAEEKGCENDLLTVARRLIESGKPLPRLYAACGTEDFLYENNRGFMQAFREPLGIHYEEGPGEHTWAFWDTYIQRVLKWLGFGVGCAGGAA